MLPSSDANFLFSISFNLYDILLITTFILSLVVALPLLFNRERKQQDSVLATFVLAQGVYALYAVLLYSQTIGQFTQSLLAPFQYLPVLLLRGFQGLLLLLFARQMMGKSIKFKSYLVLATIGITGVMSFANAIVAAFYTYNFMAFFSEWTLYLVSTILGVMAFRELTQYQTTLPHIHSNISRHSLRWLKTACAVFIALWSLRAGAMILEISGQRVLAESIYTYSQIPVLFVLGALTMYSQTHTTGFDKLFAEYAQSNIEEHKSDINNHLVERMNALMETAKIYKDPELRLDGLADCLDISPRSLTTVLNQHCNTSFYDYVNSYRVKDAQQQLLEPDNSKKPIQRIYEDAGFSSKSTFYMLFKRETGKTPSEYKKLVNQ